MYLVPSEKVIIRWPCLSSFANSISFVPVSSVKDKPEAELTAELTIDASIDELSFSFSFANSISFVPVCSVRFTVSFFYRFF